MTTSTGARSEPEPLMDLPAVARRLGVNERHIRRLVAERRIPYLKWGHLLRFEPAEIECWLDVSRHPRIAASARPERHQLGALKVASDLNVRHPGHRGV